MLLDVQLARVFFELFSGTVDVNLALPKTYGILQQQKIERLEKRVNGTKSTCKEYVCLSEEGKKEELTS